MQIGFSVRIIIMKTFIKVLLGFMFLLLSGTGYTAPKIDQDDYARYIISKPEPVIPMVALRKGWGGHVVCLLTINPKNGVVDEVKVVRHTHYPKLDAIMVMTLFNWRFRPGTITQARISYELGVYGRSRDYH